VEKAANWHLAPRRSELELGAEVVDAEHIEDAENTSSFVVRRMRILASDDLPFPEGSYYRADNSVVSFCWRKAETPKTHSRPGSPFALV
tara:strand:+ start:292 stop:558 length:267 start_codon:yes stop_codon:yes gene_type:complete